MKKIEILTIDGRRIIGNQTDIKIEEDGSVTRYVDTGTELGEVEVKETEVFIVANI